MSLVWLEYDSVRRKSRKVVSQSMFLSLSMSHYGTYEGTLMISETRDIWRRTLWRAYVEDKYKAWWPVCSFACCQPGNGNPPGGQVSKLGVAVGSIGESLVTVTSVLNRIKTHHLTRSFNFFYHSHKRGRWFQWCLLLCCQTFPVWTLTDLFPACLF